MNNYKITELGFNPTSKNTLIELNQMSGDFNLIHEAFNLLKKQKERKKESYLFKVVHTLANGETLTNFDFNMKNSEFESIKKNIPELNSRL